MEFRVLGPVDVRADNTTPYAITRPRQRSALSVLLVHANQPVTFAQMSDALWGVEQPDNPKGALRTCIYNLRRTVNLEGRLRTHSTGYMFQTHDDDLLDLHLFRDLTHKGNRARTAGDFGGAVRLLQRALELWRQPYLADLPGTPAIAPIAAELLEQRIATQEDLVDAKLALGQSREVIPLLRALTTAEPLRERQWEQLMLALFSCGRRADALEAYARARVVLAEECGVDPGAGLQRLQQRILNADSGPPDGGERVEGSLNRFPSSVVPRQLPAGVRRLAGRRGEFGELNRLLDHDAKGPPPAVIPVVGGAGTGKSALVLHWAHQMAERFPDGQLYVEMHGFDPYRPPLAPGEAIRALLSAIVVPPDQIPESLDAQVGLYRSVLAGRRTMIVLDDVRDSEQVRALVPPGSGSVAVVTSRSQLCDLTIEGVCPIVLGCLPEAEARELLAGRLTDQHLEGEREVVDELIALCAGLPLALSIVASRAAAQPDSPLKALAGELRGRNPLDALNTGEAGGDLRAALSGSYQCLSPPAMRMFRLLSIHKGGDMSAPAVAGLCGVPLAAARATLAELTRIHLVSERGQGRFVQHRLVCAYAAELSRACDSAMERRAAVRRMLHYYRDTGARRTTALVNRSAVRPLRPSDGAIDVDSRVNAEPQSSADPVDPAHRPDNGDDGQFHRHRRVRNDP